MDSNQTLHDFVLNLLTDPDARSAFELDPEGELRAAGLTDITAADVQDVVPLVVDYAPVQGLATVAPATGQLGVDPLVADTTDVVGQLQSVAQQISIGSSYGGVDVKAGALGAIAVVPSGVTVGAELLPGIRVGVGPDGMATDLTGVHDLAHTLDADVVGAVDTAADPVVGDVAGTAGNPDSVFHATDSGLLGTPEGLLGGPLAGTHGQLEGVVGSLGVDDTLGGVTGTVGGVTGGVTGTVGDVTGTVDGVTGGTVGGATGTVDGVLGGVSGSVAGDVNGDADVHAEASAPTGGVLGLTDGLF